MLPDNITEIIALLKPDGTIVPNIKANVQPNKIFIEDHINTLPIEEGDTLERKLNNGLTEKFIVIDRGYFSAIDGVPAHFQVKVKKEFKTQQSQQSVHNTYNLNAPHSRVNIGSSDSSTNISNDNSITLFSQLQQTIESAISNTDDQNALLSKLEELQKAAGTNTYSKKYTEFVSLAANYMTIIGPFIPSLTKLLSGG